MNRRGFISLLAGAAGAPLVPWRGLIEPLICLPPRVIAPAWQHLPYCSCKSPFCNRLHNGVALTQQSLEETLKELHYMTDKQGWLIRIQPTQLIVSPQVKHLIDTDPDVRAAAEAVLGHRL